MSRSTEESPPLKRTKYSEKEYTLPIQNIRLDNLVLLKCVSVTKHKFYNDFAQKLVSREFADAIQYVHCKLTISILIRSAPFSLPPLSFPIKLILTLESPRWQKCRFWTYSANILLEKENADECLKVILRNIFAQFKRVGTIDISRLKNEPMLLTITTVIVEANLTKLDRLKFGQLNFFNTLFTLLQNFSKFLKDIHFLSIVELNELHHSGTDMKPFFTALAQCNNLRKLCLDGFPISDASMKDWSDCLKMLKIKHFKAGLDSKKQWHNWLSITSKTNKILRYLSLPYQEAHFYCSPLIMPLLSNIRSISMWVCGGSRNFEPDENWKQSLLKILNAMRSDGFLKLTIINLACDIGKSNLACERILKVFNVLFKVSELTRKLIKVSLHVGYMHRHLEGENIIPILTTAEQFKGIAIIRHEKKSFTILHLNNARIFLLK